METTNQDPSLQDIFQLLRQGLRIALLISVLFASVTFFISRTLRPMFETTTTLLATQPDQGLRGLDVSLVTAPRVNFTVYEAALGSSPVHSDVTQRLNDPQAFDDISIAVTTKEDLVSSLINITVTGPKPLPLADVTNALAGALVSWDERRASRTIDKTVSRLESQITVLDEQIRALSTVDTESSQTQLNELLIIRNQRLTDLNLARTFKDSAVASIEVLEPAAVPIEPVAPRPLRNAIFAFALGLLLTYGVLLLRNALDTRIRTSEDLAKLSGFPVMAKLPKQTQRSPQAFQEAVSYLHTNLLFAAPNTHPRVILVTSSQDADEKFDLAFHVAKSFAKSENGVLLVDADLRNPSIAKRFNLNDTSYPSLQMYLENPEETLQPVPLFIDLTHQLEIIPSFQAAPSPSELLRIGFRQCLEKWKAIYDVIIIDSAPLLAVADPLTIAPLCDTITFAVNVQDANRKEIQSAVELLKRSNVPVIGFVATETENNTRNEAYGYSYTAQNVRRDPRSTQIGPKQTQARAIKHNKS